MMKYVRAFISGIVLPSLVLPILICIALALGKPKILTIPFLHFLPLIWGFWNVLYFAFFRTLFPNHVNARLLLAGALLGILIAVYGVFGLNLPLRVGLPQSLHDLPLIVVPLLYAILWRFVVKPLNSLLNLKDE